MKKVIAIVLGLALLITLLTSCGATKKATKAKEVQLDSVAVAKVMKERTERSWTQPGLNMGKLP